MRNSLGKLVVALCAITCSFSFAQANPPAPSVVAPADQELQPLTPELIMASQGKLYKVLRDQVEKARTAGTISKEQAEKMSSSWKDLSNQLLLAADDSARIASQLGSEYFVGGLLITYGSEYVLGANGRILALGPSIEVGVGMFINANFEAVFTGVIIGGFAFEQSLDVNLTQNRSQPDRGWRVKGVFGLKKNQNINNFSGVYVGGGFDAQASFTGKGYIGGCFKRDSFMHADLVANGTLLTGEGLVNKAWQVPYNYVREHIANCNSIIISIGHSSNVNAPPWSIVEKGLVVQFPASNRGFGFHATDIWTGLRTGVWE